MRHNIYATTNKICYLLSPVALTHLPFYEGFHAIGVNLLVGTLHNLDESDSEKSRVEPEFVRLKSR